MIKEVSETRAITYDFQYYHDDGYVRLGVHNISSKLPIESLSFHVTCPELSKSCIAPLPGQTALARHFVVQPIGSTSLAFGEVNSSEIAFNLSLPPGESAYIDIGKADVGAELGFYFQPGGSGHGLDLVFLDREGLFAYMVDNYIEILIYSLFFVGGVLFAFIVCLIVRCLVCREAD
ncbi:hypothetical protein ACFQH5_17990 [Halomonas salifodinae]|uniref:Uncharacterized protein n=1 Tax=Halomonas salifodinae TaxID=438745 RepID=A0ABW2F1Z3_9GAMM